MNKKGLRINYGCGDEDTNTNRSSIGDLIGIDIRPCKGVDIVLGEDRIIPLEDNSVEYIFTSNVLEHVEDLFKTISEFYRICRNDAIIEIYVPHFSSTKTHFEYHRRSCRYSFLDCHCNNALSSYPKYFDTLERKLIMSPRWKILEKLFNKHHTLFEDSILSSMFTCFEVYVKLKVVK